MPTTAPTRPSAEDMQNYTRSAFIQFLLTSCEVVREKVKVFNGLYKLEEECSMPDSKLNRHEATKPRREGDGQRNDKLGVGSINGVLYHEVIHVTDLTEFF